MLLTFVRHATAEDRETAAVDFDRILIEKGHRQVGRIQAFCQSNGLVPGTLLSSPYPRALETANGLARLQTLQHRKACKPNVVEWLRLESDPAETIARISQLDADINDLWLTGHEPHLSAVITLLLHNHADCHAAAAYPQAMIKVKKASITRLEYDPLRAAAKLLWSVPCAFMPS